jgi:o-succinylbenzoate synthase
MSNNRVQRSKSLRELKRKIKIPLRIAVDEIIRKAPDPFKVDLTDAADVVMLKVQPLGGIQRSLDIAAHHGLPVVVSSALESAIGIEYGLDLAASVLATSPLIAV